MKKIVNVKKFVVSTTILFLLILLGGSALVNATYSCNKIDYKTVYVTQGDTLWKIASEEKENNSYYKDKDVRDIIYDIKEINGLKVSNLQIGQELKIPTK
jgi:LysM repeat protein